MTALPPPKVCQRWRSGRASYRPAGEPFDPRRFEVGEIPGDREAKAFVVASHYSASYPSARWRFGLYRGAQLVGVAVFSWPQHPAVLTNVFPGAWEESTELGRFVLSDSVPGNGESFFLARCFDVLRRRVRGVVSFSDPVPRLTSEGAEVMPGHVGVIYQATNALYLGRGRKKSLDLFPDGTAFDRRALTKLIGGEQGRRYAEARLVKYGAPPLDGCPRAYLAAWLPRLTRSLPHPGNHRYAFAFNRADRRRIEGLSRQLAAPLSRPLPYPKRVEVLRCA